MNKLNISVLESTLIQAGVRYKKTVSKDAETALFVNVDNNDIIAIAVDGKIIFPDHDQLAVELCDSDNIVAVAEYCVEERR